jgi:hypothetical protein
MKPVVGVSSLTPAELAQVPTQAAEQPGIGKVIGAIVGGAIGLAATGSLPAVLGSFFVPGADPLRAIGMAGGTTFQLPRGPLRHA